MGPKLTGHGVDGNASRHLPDQYIEDIRRVNSQ
jgi:hypothetical protein